MTIKAFFNSNTWGIISIIFAIIVLFGGEWYHYVLALIGFASGIQTLYKNHKNKNDLSLRPKCECGYIALDERELHNHKITCEKSKPD